MDTLDVYKSLEAISSSPSSFLISDDPKLARMIMQHKEWLKNIRHERPNVTTPFKIGVYIRYFNQTKYDNYLSYHKKQFEDSIALCPNWTLEDFYIDEGSSVPNMESSPAWCRLLTDCMNRKIDLIITQKISNVSKSIDEITICARLLASQDPPIGIYFISEDIFTLASYYQEDLHDTYLLPNTSETPKISAPVEE
ncbi:DNA recombinase [Oribacterium sp. C9]|uniref:recombinase family protein n=1 Tax=Oribacterium sp. C9 TaxID=1943579 RepID=UPI00098EA0CA|nr:recombinase family protein [Oribacterium sp. C9]OON87460.1 DNA recombinase [Oribacterium sp. C9]